MQCKPNLQEEDEETLDKSNQKNRGKTENFRKIQNRPLTAGKSPGQALPKKVLKTTENNVVSRLRPRVLATEKEKLYDENIELKQKNNAFVEEIVKLKTRLFHIEKELHKKEEKNDEVNPNGSKQNHFLASLKQLVKDLKGQLLEKTTEVEGFKKNIKLSKTIELETEMKVYSDECIRLKHHLEEIMRQNDGNFTVSSSTIEKSVQQSLLSSNLKKENQDLLENIESLKEVNANLQQKIHELEVNNKKFRPKKTEIAGLKSEIKRLKEEISKTNSQALMDKEKSSAEIDHLRQIIAEYENSSKKTQLQLRSYESTIENLEAEGEFLKKNSLNQSKSTEKSKNKCRHKSKNPPKLFSVLHSIVQSKKMFIGVLLSLIDKNNIGIIEKEDFFQKIRKYSSQVKRKYIDEIIASIGHKGTLISLNKLEGLYDQYEYDDYFENSSSSDQDFEKKVIKGPKDSGNILESQRELEKKDSPQSLKENILEQPTEILDFEEDIESDTKSPLKTENSTLKLKETVIKPEEIPSVPKETPAKLEVIPLKPKKLAMEPQKPVCKDPVDSKLSEILKHMYFKFQISRVSKKSIQSLLFGSLRADQSISKSLFSSILKSPPLNISDLSDQECLFNYFGEHLSVLSIVHKLEGSLDDWTILTGEEEDEYDEIVSEFVDEHHDTLLNKCLELDPGQSGTIKAADFLNILQDCNAFFDSSITNYLLLLFYSHENKLNSAPYVHFFKVYRKPMPKLQIPDEKRAELVRCYLTLIAQALIEYNYSTSEIFQCINGSISVEDMYEGCQKLGLEINKEHVEMMVEAIRDESSEKLCVNANELDSILIHYGVVMHEASYDVDQRILEVDEEYGEDSEEYSMSQCYSSDSQSEYSDSYEEADP